MVVKTWCRAVCEIQNLLVAVLIEGVLFRARYLGSTQLISDGQPSKAVRMLQAQEAIGRIKVQAAQCTGFLAVASNTEQNSGRVSNTSGKPENLLE